MSEKTPRPNPPAIAVERNRPPQRPPALLFARPPGRGRIVRLCLLAAAFCAPPVVSAQPPDPHAVQPERPSVATHAATVAPGWLELEFGAGRESSHGVFLDMSLPLNVKLGVAPAVQFAISMMPTHVAGGDGFTAESVALSLKWRLADDVPLFGAVALLPSVQVPALHAADASPGAGLVLISSITVRGVSLDLNVGYARRARGDAADAWTSETMWAAAGGGPIAGPLAWGAEIFGIHDVAQDRRRSRAAGVLAGLTVTARPWLAFDVSGVLPAAGVQPRAIQAGAVWNAGRFWRRGAARPARPALAPRTARGVVR
ncbi:MAG: hypothetical protein IT184_10785 [Acidobacteria bacterium]|nr:hypothetical protein [Acidobacteriota bacterium]